MIREEGTEGDGRGEGRRLNGPPLRRHPQRIHSNKSFFSVARTFLP